MGFISRRSILEHGYRLRTWAQELQSANEQMHSNLTPFLWSTCTLVLTGHAAANTEAGCWPSHETRDAPKTWDYGRWSWYGASSLPHGNHLVRRLEDLGAERHNSTQHWQRPEDEKDPRGLDSLEALKLDQEGYQELEETKQKTGGNGEWNWMLLC